MSTHEFPWCTNRPTWGWRVELQSIRMSKTSSGTVSLSPRRRTIPRSRFSTSVTRNPPSPRGYRTQCRPVRESRGFWPIGIDAATGGALSTTAVVAGVTVRITNGSQLGTGDPGTAAEDCARVWHPANALAPQKRRASSAKCRTATGPAHHRAGCPAGERPRMVPTFTTESIDERGAHLDPDSIATATPQTSPWPPHRTG
jgi:hypothetical protein